MDRDELENRKREVERRYGVWISHNLQLQDDLYTIQRGVAGGNEARVRRVVQLVADPFAELLIDCEEDHEFSGRCWSASCGECDR